MNDDYSYKVYRSLMKRKLTLGIPTVPLLVIVLITVVTFLILESFIMVPLSIIAYIVMKEITKKDEYAIEIFMNSLLEPEQLS